MMNLFDIYQYRTFVFNGLLYQGIDSQYVSCTISLSLPRSSRHICDCPNGPSPQEVGRSCRRSGPRDCK